MSDLQWWAVLTPALRTGLADISYVQASSRQQAAESDVGVTVLGGPYPSEAAAQRAFPQGSAGSTASHSGPPVLSLKPVNPIGGLAAIGDFFGKLGEASTWIRVGQVALGLILIAVGVARITHAVPIATKLASTVGMAAI